MNLNRIKNRTARYIPAIQAYILGICLFYILIIFIPWFKDSYFLPKLMLLQVAASLLLVFEAIKILVSRQYRIEIRKSFFYISGFILINALSLYVSKAPSISFWGFYQHEGLNFYPLMAIFIIIIFYISLDRKLQNVIQKFIVMGISVSALFVIYKSYGDFISSRTIDRPLGTEGHPIWTSGVIGLGIFIVMQLNLAAVRPLVRIIIKSTLILIYIGALFFLNSATTWLSLGISLFLWVFLLVRKQKSLQNWIMSITLIALLIFLLLSALNLYEIKTFSVNKRIIELKTAATAILYEIKQPEKYWLNILFGNGQNTSGFLYAKFKTPDQNMDKEWLSNITNIHHHFLELFITTGFLGTLLWFVINVQAIRHEIEINSMMRAAMLIYLILWQQLYFLTPGIYILAWIFITDSLGKRKIASVFFDFQRHKIIPVCISLCLFIIAAIYLYIAGASATAEYYFSRADTHTAVTIMPYNDVYFSTDASAVMSQIKNCTQSNQREAVFCQSPMLNRNFDRIFTDLKKAIQINPLNGDNWNNVGTALFYRSLLSDKHKGLYRTRAIRYGKKAMELDPINPFFTNNVGAVYFDMRDYPNAEKYFLASYNLKPDFIATLRHLRDLYRQMGIQTKMDYYIIKIELLNRQYYCTLNDV